MPTPSMSELPQAERGIGPWLRLLRPSHWTKNFFVLAPLLFSGQARDLRVVESALLAFLSFCLAASSVYAFNDVLDRDADRSHPTKRLRPVAAGLISTGHAIGAAVTLTEAFAALVHERPQLQTFGQRFAGLPVRNSGTLGGNVANGSPIGDAMPLLIALGASVVLMRWKNNKTGGEIAHRELRLEDLYTGYRTNVMRADELLCWIKVPRPTGHALERVYKISKRFDDDISAVCLAIQMTVKGGVVQQVSIGAGGVAATPARARQTEAALLGQPWTADTVMASAAALRAEFQPISDMRASAAYRQTVLGNLLQRFWLESQGLQGINLDSLKTVEALA